MGPTRPNLTSPLTAVERSLRDSLHASEFRDVYLYAFSRRTVLPDGTMRINHPLPVVAVSSILKNTESFSKLLEDPGAVQQQASSSEYDYESDSDLDEFEELQDPDLEPSPIGLEPTPAEGSSPEGDTKNRTEDSANDQAAATGSPVAAAQRYLQVPVPNIAYRTLHACVFYLYTGKINFLPLTSSGSQGRQMALLTSSDDLAPPCSPKSMYRLADLYGLTELQDLAYSEVVAQLKPENILEEAFSSFIVRYDRLREHAISYLCQNYSTPAVQQSLPDIIQRIALGEMPHASGVLRSLLGLPAVISPRAWGRVPHSRAVKPTHFLGNKPMLPPLSANDLQTQSIPKLGEASQPGGTPAASRDVAVGPVPLPSDSALTAASGPSSSVTSGAAPPGLVNGETLLVTPGIGSAENTARVGTEGGDGSTVPAAAREPYGIAQLTVTHGQNGSIPPRLKKKKKGPIRERSKAQPSARADQAASTSADPSTPISDTPRSPQFSQGSLGLVLSALVQEQGWVSAAARTRGSAD